MVITWKGLSTLRKTICKWLTGSSVDCVRWTRHITRIHVFYNASLGNPVGTTHEALIAFYINLRQELSLPLFKSTKLQVSLKMFDSPAASVPGLHRCKCLEHWTPVVKQLVLHLTLALLMYFTHLFDLWVWDLLFASTSCRRYFWTFFHILKCLV